MKVLIAEDEPIMLKTLQMRLKKDGFDVISSMDGREAISQIESQHPDLIISDIMMPYASGLEIVGHVRHTLKRNTPIIILSAMGQENVVLDAFKQGANDYITKPFNPQELSLRVKRLMEPQAPTA